MDIFKLFGMSGEKEKTTCLYLFVLSEHADNFMVLVQNQNQIKVLEEVSDFSLVSLTGEKAKPLQ